MKKSDSGCASECSKVKYKANTLNGMLCELIQQLGESAGRCKTKERMTRVRRDFQATTRVPRTTPHSEEE